MFGGCVTSAVNYLLGIRPEDDTSTYQNIVIAPVTPHGMNHAKGSIDTPWGRIESGWERDAGRIIFEVTVPTGICAKFCYKEHRQELQVGIRRIVLEERE